MEQEYTAEAFRALVNRAEDTRMEKVYAHFLEEMRREAEEGEYAYITCMRMPPEFLDWLIRKGFSVIVGDEKERWMKQLDYGYDHEYIERAKQGDLLKTIIRWSRDL